MLVATLLALAAAVLHAAWNLAAKSSSDRLLSLWGQFVCGGIIGAVVIVANGGIDSSAWRWAAISGVVHVPYLAALARAYDRGDFSVAYPVARGGGAALAAVGGIVFLHDDLGPWSLIGIAIVVIGMALLAVGADRVQVALALVVAVTIGVYSTADGHGARAIDSAIYVCASKITSALGMTIYGVSIGRGGDLLRAARAGQWKRYLISGMTSLVAYGLVLIAARRAPLGYVAAIRESSVLLAAFAGWRLLDEGNHRRRLSAAGVIVAGLVLLVATR